jgi:hypothetical protein
MGLSLFSLIFKEIYMILNCFFLKIATFELLIIEGRGWSHFLHIFQVIPFRINFLKIDSQGASYDPYKAVGI